MIHLLLWIIIIGNMILTLATIGRGRSLLDGFLTLAMVAAFLIGWLVSGFNLGLDLMIGGMGIRLYFMPSIFADSRRHPSATAIFLINLLAGWMIVGWVGAFFWALSAPQTKAI